MSITHVTVLGAGVLGSQIAFQTAFKGFQVTVYDINDDALAAARQRFAGLATTYAAEVAGADDATLAAAQTRLQLTSDLAAAVKDADLVIEAIPELLDLKKSMYAQLATLAPEKTIFATNSSTLLPSDLKGATGRPAKFLALHFANRIWALNTAEVMGTADTDPAVFQQVVGFAEAIGMVPIPIHKEKAGYVLNSLLVPFLIAGLDLVAGGYASPEDVDKTWKIGTAATFGPMQIMDIIGMATPYNILMNGNEDLRQLAAWLKATYIDQGKLGVATGEGFYNYRT
ncbi:MAG: 3-hydroxyacyl-CoA dehydrogenase [Burkholderiaceae bacterium]